MRAHHILAAGAAVLAATTLPAQQPYAAPRAAGPTAPRRAHFTVRIENVSTPGTLKLSNGQTAPAPTSPGAWAVYRGRDPLFTPGVPDAGRGLERQAEEGNPAMLAGAVAGASGVETSGTFAVPVGERAAGPLLPGKAYEFSFEAGPGDRLTLATMFAQSNDLFYAPGRDGIALFRGGRPITGDVTASLRLWDAGTEVNEEPGLGPTQAPRQKAPNSGAAERRPVALVNDSYTYPTTGAVLRVTVSSSALAATAH